MSGRCWASKASRLHFTKFRYAKSPKRAIKKWLLLLDRYDTLERRRTDIREELRAVQSSQGPKSSRAKKLTAKLAEFDAEWRKIEVAEAKVRNLGLLPVVKKSQAKARR